MQQQERKTSEALACSMVRHAAKGFRRDAEGGFSQASEDRQRLDIGSYASVSCLR